MPPLLSGATRFASAAVLLAVVLRRAPRLLGAAGHPPGACRRRGGRRAAARRRQRARRARRVTRHRGRLRHRRAADRRPCRCWSCSSAPRWASDRGRPRRRRDPRAARARPAGAPRRWRSRRAAPGRGPPGRRRAELGGRVRAVADGSSCRRTRSSPPCGRCSPGRPRWRASGWRAAGAGVRHRRRDGELLARAGVPRRLRIRDRLQRVRLAAAERVGDARVDLRVREPGRRRAARRAVRRRTDHPAWSSAARCWSRPWRSWCPPNGRAAQIRRSWRSFGRRRLGRRRAARTGPASIASRNGVGRQLALRAVPEPPRARASRTAGPGPGSARRRTAAAPRPRRPSVGVEPGQRSGSSPSSQPTRNTTGNSRPFAACRVSSVTASARGSSASTSAPVASCLQERARRSSPHRWASGSQQVDGRPDVLRARRRVGAVQRRRGEPLGQHLRRPARTRAASDPPSPSACRSSRAIAPHPGPVAQPVVRALLHRDAGPGQRLDDRRRPARRCGRARRCRRTDSCPAAPPASRPGPSRTSGATGRRPARRSSGPRSPPRPRRDAAGVAARPAAPPGRAGPGRAGGR